MQIIRKRCILNEEHWKDRGEELIELFLNSALDDNPHVTPKRRNGDIGSLWIDVRRSLQNYGIKLESVNGESLQLHVPHTNKPLDTKTWSRHLKLHMKLRHLRKWEAMKDQGKTVRLHGGIGSKFLQKSKYLWDADYIFAIKGRLNQVDTRSVLKRKGIGSTTICRAANCSQHETLPHVLNNCAGTMDRIRARHDASLTLITKAIARTARATKGKLTITVNSTVDGYSGPVLKPDLLVIDEENKTAVLADLAIAFEEQQSDNDAASKFDEIKRKKLTKYAPLKAHLQRQGYKTELSALVYGSLGSVANGNYQVYTEQLGLLKKDARQLEYTLATNHIKASKRIWGFHTLQPGNKHASTTAQSTNNNNNGQRRNGTAAPAGRSTTSRPRTKNNRGPQRTTGARLGGDSAQSAPQRSRPATKKSAPRKKSQRTATKEGRGGDRPSAPRNHGRHSNQPGPSSARGGEQRGRQPTRSTRSVSTPQVGKNRSNARRVEATTASRKPNGNVAKTTSPRPKPTAQNKKGQKRR
jgi:hypothetical protein